MLFLYSGNEGHCMSIHCRTRNRQVRINGWFTVRKDDGGQRWPTANVLNFLNQKIGSNGQTVQCPISERWINTETTMFIIFQETLYTFYNNQVFLWGLPLCSNSGCKQEKNKRATRQKGSTWNKIRFKTFHLDSVYEWILKLSTNTILR